MELKSRQLFQLSPAELRMLLRPSYACVTTEKGIFPPLLRSTTRQQGGGQTTTVLYDSSRQGESGRRAQGDHPTVHHPTMHTVTRQVPVYRLADSQCGSLQQTPPKRIYLNVKNRPSAESRIPPSFPLQGTLRLVKANRVHPPDFHREGAPYKYFQSLRS